MTKWQSIRPIHLTTSQSYGASEVNGVCGHFDTNPFRRGCGCGCCLLQEVIIRRRPEWPGLSMQVKWYLVKNGGRWQWVAAIRFGPRLVDMDIDSNFENSFSTMTWMPIMVSWGVVRTYVRSVRWTVSRYRLSSVEYLRDWISQGCVDWVAHRCTGLVIRNTK